jgi:hypothetical protein
LLAIDDESRLNRRTSSLASQPLQGRVAAQKKPAMAGFFVLPEISAATDR